MSSEKWIPPGSSRQPREESTSNLSSISDESLSESYEEGEIIVEKVIHKHRKVLWKPPVQIRYN